MVEWVRECRAPRVLVPTMGALHEGHLSLCRAARDRAGEAGVVVATIFVNPTQFGPNEDLDAYPRQLAADLAACEAVGVDVVFAPQAGDVYASDASVSISEATLALGLCGGSRPGHFDGVCTVVAKLFNLTQPVAAVFGEKDYQQLAVIRRMVRDLNFPIEIVPGPTVREADGLAMSSRNAYLTPSQRQAAPGIQQAMVALREEIAAGKYEDSPSTAVEALEGRLEQVAGSESRVDYVALVHPDTLQPLESFWEDGELRYRLIVAVFVGKTRLIDNIGAN